MTITQQQWEAIASEANTTVEALRARVAEIDDAVGDREQIQVEFDRDGDPITMGQWCVLYDSRWYRFIRETILPSRVWICTIWQGISYDLWTTPHTFFETAVFWLGVDQESLPPPQHVQVHASEAEALQVHEQLVREWARGFSEPLPL